MPIVALGIMSNQAKKKCLQLALSQLQQPSDRKEHQTDPPTNWLDFFQLILALGLTICPVCKQGKLILVGVIPNQRAPPNGDFFWLPIDPN